MSRSLFSLDSLRARRSQDFDGEAHLTNEELDALVDAVEETLRYQRRMVSRRAQRQEPQWMPKAAVDALAKFEMPPRARRRDGC